MKHTCHAVNCQNNCSPELLFCRSHWKLLPRHLQQAIRAAYVPGQEKTKRITADYYLAQREAVAAVAVKEGVWTVERVAGMRRTVWTRTAKALCKRERRAS